MSIYSSVCLFLFVLTSSFTTALYANPTTNFVVGTTSGYAPFVSLDENGKYVGFDIDLANALAKKLQRTLVIKDCGSMPALFLALKQGKVDALIWAISITKERQEKVSMIYYQGQKVTSLPLLFWKEQGASLKELSQDKKSIVCVEAGSFQDSFLQTIPGLTIKYVDKVTDALMEIKYGKSRATIIDPSLLPKYKAQFPELTICYEPLSESDQSLGNGICINKSNQELVTLVQEAVDALRQDNTIQKLEAKWGLETNGS